MGVQLQGNVCLGILNGTEVGLDDLSLLGGIHTIRILCIFFFYLETMHEYIQT